MATTRSEAGPDARPLTTFAPPGDVPHCPNCGAPAPEAYCGRCGQPQQDHLRTSLGDLAREGVEELLAWDAKILTSFRRLLLSPGFLTTEYLAGRRARYLRPLRLYLTASVVFFLVASLLPGELVNVGGQGVSAGGGAIRFGVTETAGDIAAATSASASPDSTGPSFERVVERRLTQLDSLGPEGRRTLSDHVERTLPKAVFAMVPLFALLLRGLHARQGLYYAEHLIFALHVHAFGFLLFTLVELCSSVTASGLVDAVAVVWLLGYLFVALRRVYGRTRARTALTMLVLVPAYGLVLSMAMLGALALALFAA